MKKSKAPSPIKKFLSAMRPVVTKYVESLNPPPSNPTALFYELMEHHGVWLLMKAKEAAEDDEKGCCDIATHCAAVETEHQQRLNILAAHNPAYADLGVPLSQRKIAWLENEIQRVAVEITAPFSPPPEALRALGGEIGHYFLRIVERYTFEPWGELEGIREFAQLVKEICQWSYRWNLATQPEGIAAHVNHAYWLYIQTFSDTAGPLPPKEQAMLPLEGVRSLEELTRRLDQIIDENGGAAAQYDLPVDTQFAPKDIDKQILRHLEEQGSACTQEMIADGTEIGEKTVGKRLAVLREHGFTNRPHGERGGDAITSIGTAFLEKHPEKGDDDQAA